MNQRGITELPSTKDLEAELQRVRRQGSYKSILKSTVYTLVIVAAIAILAATLWIPVLEIYGTSMTPTLQDGELVLAVKGSGFEPGDIVAFYYNNKILVKRVIASAGDWVDIDSAGNVYINGEQLEEPYLKEKARGNVDIELPYQVPDEKIFVMGDHRATSVDSRSKAVGCVDQEQIVGKIIFRIWPISHFAVIR